jgi:hypothetical protein
MLKKLIGILKGGKGSGNFGHSGRPGEQGGSSSGGGGGRAIGRAIGEAEGSRMMTRWQNYADEAVKLRGIAGPPERYQQNLDRLRVMANTVSDAIKNVESDIKYNNKKMREYPKGSRERKAAYNQTVSLGVIQDELINAGDEIRISIDSLNRSLKSSR